MCFCFNHHFGFSGYLLSSLWCIFTHVFPSHLSTITGYQGVHSSQTTCVRTSHAPFLTHYSGHMLATDKVILLSSMQNHGPGITIRPTTRTPTPNGLRSNWNLLPGRSPWHIGGSSIVNISSTRKRAKWQAVSSHPVLNLCIPFMDSCTLLPLRCFLNREGVSIAGEFFDLL